MRLNLSLYDSLTMLVVGYLILLLCAERPLGNIETVTFYIASYIIGLVYHRIVEHLLGCSRNMKCMLRKSHHEIDKEFPKKFNLHATKDDYYTAYYRLMQNGYLNSISILEAQAAFIRNIVPILVAYIIALCGNCSTIQDVVIRTFGNCGTVSLILFIIVIALIFIWYNTQCKIHKLVWEGSCFIK